MTRSGVRHGLATGCGFAALAILVGVEVGNPDMPRIRLLMTYWWVYGVAVVFILGAIVLELSGDD